MKKSILSIILSISLLSTTFCQLVTFPGADGDGKLAQGGRRGQLITISSLNPQEFIDALEAQGPRVIVFAVSGIIDMGNAAANITDPFVTIAGQTAPSPGITIKGRIVIKTSEVVVQHLAVRPGFTSSDQHDAITISTAGVNQPISNIYLDHLSVSWGRDENLAFFQRDALIHNVTISNCIISEGLVASSGDSIQGVNH